MNTGREFRKMNLNEGIFQHFGRGTGVRASYTLRLQLFLPWLQSFNFGLGFFTEMVASSVWIVA